MQENMCHCGKPLHYSNKSMQSLIEEMNARMGSEYLIVKVGVRRYLVQRHYIALHGLAATEIAKLGFREVYS